jgi:hypothetical protein
MQSSGEKSPCSVTSCHAIYELRDLLPNPPPASAYFRDLDRTLAEIPQKRKQYRDVERDLQALDADAWAFLKSELKPLLATKDPKRGWQPLFDKLNQAKAFRYLKGKFGEVTFIPPSAAKGRKTPDLSTQAGAALCEVKTINTSEIEADRRHAGGVGTIEVQLNPGFFNKLGADLVQARAQMNVFDPSPAVRKMVYVVVNFDDTLHEYADFYRLQIEHFIETNNPAPELEVVLDIKPPFYAAKC